MKYILISLCCVILLSACDDDVIWTDVDERCMLVNDTNKNLKITIINNNDSITFNVWKDEKYVADSNVSRYWLKSNATITITKEDSIFCTNHHLHQWNFDSYLYIQGDSKIVNKALYTFIINDYWLYSVTDSVYCQF